MIRAEIYFIFDEHCPPGEHELKVPATDWWAYTRKKLSFYRYRKIKYLYSSLCSRTRIDIAEPVYFFVVMENMLSNTIL